MGMRRNSSVNTLTHQCAANYMGKSWHVRSLIFGHALWPCFRCSKGEDMRDYFMRKYEDLYNIYIRLEDELAYELDPNKGRIEWAKPTWLNFCCCKSCHHL